MASATSQRSLGRKWNERTISWDAADQKDTMCPETDIGKDFQTSLPLHRRSSAPAAPC